MICPGTCEGSSYGNWCTCASEAADEAREERLEHLERLHREGATSEDFFSRYAQKQTPRQSVLNEAGELIHSDRNVAYGPPMKNFQRIADLWNTILGDQLKEPITTWQVADMSIAIKLARNIEKPKRDNYVDVAGYAACGWECAEGSENCE